jgi:hypothetical protein
MNKLYIATPVDGFSGNEQTWQPKFNSERPVYYVVLSDGRIEKSYYASGQWSIENASFKNKVEFILRPITPEGIPTTADLRIRARRYAPLDKLSVMEKRQGDWMTGADTVLIELSPIIAVLQEENRRKDEEIAKQNKEIDRLINQVGG